MNRNDVIDHLQIIRTWAAVGKDPIYQGIEPKCCEDVEKWIDEALELLQEKNPRTETNNQGFVYGYCGSCGHVLAAGKPKYCYNCGQAVKWE